MKRRVTHKHVDMVKEVNTEGGQLQDELGIVGICAAVLPRSVVMHVPQMDNVPEGGGGGGGGGGSVIYVSFQGISSLLPRLHEDVSSHAMRWS